VGGDDQEGDQNVLSITLQRARENGLTGVVSFLWDSGVCSKDLKEVLFTTSFS